MTQYTEHFSDPCTVDQLFFTLGIVIALGAFAWLMFIAYLCVKEKRQERLAIIERRVHAIRRMLSSL